MQNTKGMARQILGLLRDLAPLTVLTASGGERKLTFAEMRIEKAYLDGFRYFLFSQPDNPRSFPAKLKHWCLRLVQLPLAGYNQLGPAASDEPGFSGTVVEIWVERMDDPQVRLVHFAAGYKADAEKHFAFSILAGTQAPSFSPHVRNQNELELWSSWAIHHFQRHLTHKWDVSHLPLQRNFT